MAIKSHVIKTVPREQLDYYREHNWRIREDLENGFVEIHKKLKHWELFEVKMRQLFKDAGFEDTIDINEFHYTDLGYQIDVIGGVDTTLLIIDCTTSEETSEGGNRSLKSKIGDCLYKKSKIESRVAEVFRNKYDKVILAIVSQGATLNEVERDTAKSSGVFVSDSEFFEHCMRISDTLGPTIRYQILRYLTGDLLPFPDTDNGKPLRILAFRKEVARRPVYNFSLDPETLLKLSYVERLHYGAKKGYQRPLKLAKLREINQYLCQDGSAFPNDIIVSFDETRGCRLSWTEIESCNLGDGGIQVGWLTIPKNYAIAEVIDGQHRLYGYLDFSHNEELEAILARRRKGDTLGVVALSDPSGRERAQTYITINSKQTKISTRELWVLMGEHYPNMLMGYISNLVRKLSSKGVFKDCISIPGTTKGTRSVNIANFGKGILDRRLVNIEGPSWNLIEKRETLKVYPLEPQDKAVDVLNQFFRFVRDSYDDDWDKKGNGFLCTNNGVNVMLRLLCEILDYFDGSVSETKLKRLLRPERGKDVIRDYVQTVGARKLARMTSNETGRAEVATDIVSEINKYDRKFGYEYLVDRGRI